MKSLAFIATFFVLTCPALAFESPVEGVRTLETRADGSLLAESKGQLFEIRPVVFQQQDDGPIIIPVVGAGWDRVMETKARVGLIITSKYGDVPAYVITETELGINGGKAAVGLGSLALAYLVRRGVLELKGVAYKPWRQAGSLQASPEDTYAGAEFEIGAMMLRFTASYLRKVSGNGPGKRQGWNFGGSYVVQIHR